MQCFLNFKFSVTYNNKHPNTSIMSSIPFYLTELLFPRLCVVCGNRLIEQEQLICLHCLHHIPRTNFHVEAENPVARLFYGRVQVEQATSFFYFSKGSKYQTLLHSLKYKGMKELGVEIGKHFAID